MATATVAKIGVGVCALGGAALLGTAAAAGPPRLHGDQTWPPRTKQAPGFQLHDLNGGRFSLRRARGRPTMLTFMYSHCREICPLEGAMLGQVERSVRGWRVRPNLVVVSVDPGGDTRASVNRFARRYRWPAGWHWLEGSRRQLARVWRAYRIDVQGAGNAIGHGAALFLLDAHGYERSAFAIPFLPTLVAADLRVLERATA